jgi:site-specific DNA-methyltransferase (adenine-specific)
MIDLRLGDCLEVLKTLPHGSVDAIVTDPPAGIGFMGKEWDKDKGGRDRWVAWMRDIAAECLRVLKPGGHALVWAIPRTSHWTATAWEDAGFEIRDRVAHVFGSGFPKSLDVSKALEAHAKTGRSDSQVTGDGRSRVAGQHYTEFRKANFEKAEFTPTTDAARQWQGWGTALKPAMEDWWLCRKPLIGTVAENVLAHGTGAINVDGCRIATDENLNGGGYTPRANGNSWAETGGMNKAGACAGEFVQPSGRWPSHLIHDGSDEVVGLFPVTTSGKMKAGTPYPGGNVYGAPSGETKADTYGDTGSAARFFYCAKASKRDRDEGLEGFEEKSVAQEYGLKTSVDTREGRSEGNRTNAARANSHPTVKATELMRYLCRLITPPGGTVLDPFMGSGSTGKAAVLEGFRFIGIEREAEYIEIARARIAAVESRTEQLELL